MEIHGRSVLLTGATGGVGQAIARRTGALLSLLAPRTSAKPSRFAGAERVARQHAGTR